MPPDLDGAGTPVPWIVIGLGNPGDEYSDTYHNVGFHVVDILAERGHAPAWSEPGAVGMIPARIVRTAVGRLGGEAILVQPWTYMNRCGRTLPPLFDRFGTDARLLVVSDDLALPVGRVRVREKGSAGGHNGLKSITWAYGSDDYCRVRVGIDRDRPTGDARDYVLSRVRAPDREMLGRAEVLAADAVETVITDGVQAAMSRFNGVDLRAPEDEGT